MPDTTADPALLRIEGPIATITLNRPAAFNSIDLTIAQKLEQLGAEVEGNDAIRVLVIEGEGRAFSAGGDLQTIGAAAAADNIAPVVGELLKHYHAFIETVRRMPKIVLSSVNGSAAGAGMGLAFITDLCIAADDARFTPAYAKIGVSPDGGSTVGMVGTVGTRRALQLFLAEDSFTAQQAYEWGLVARVVPAAALKAETRKFAERLAQNPPAAIAGTKSLVYQAAVTPTKQQLDAEEAGIIAAMHTDDFRRRGEEIHQQVEMTTRLFPVVPADAGTISSRVRADIPRPRRRLEAADRFRDHLLRQPQHHLREIDREGDGDQEHDIDRQRRA